MSDFNLKPSVNKVLEGIKEFNAETQRMVEHNGFGKSYLMELNEIRKELLDLQMKLLRHSR